MDRLCWFAGIREKKTVVALDEAAAKAQELLSAIQTDMLDRARTHRDSHTYVARGL